ncbi:MAG TPA: glycosyltransferase [Gemmatimonadaceae bacterium]|nr:glycosyltransferase [Gemmatimonadaceae bacterium]
MSVAALVALAALPWLLVPAALLWPLRHGKSLDDYPARPPRDAPLVSVIVPARDEARNIEACVRSILRSTWPRFEVIVVNDHSTDGTGDIARRIAHEDPRVRAMDAPELPRGWFGKQWACHTGARAARGAAFVFTDADTRHSAELLARSVNAMKERGADLFSVGGLQALDTFWELLLQPHVLAMIVARFRSPERMSRSTNPYHKLANGQFILVRRETYVATGGHEAVRSHVAEDLQMAQQWTRAGLSVQVVPGVDYMTTRMYHGFREIALGWGKNIYAAGRTTLPLGKMGRTVLRATFPAPALWEIMPAALGVASLFGAVSPAVGAWGAISYVFTTTYWLVMHHVMRVPLRYAFLHPLAALAMFGIFARAAWKGDRVEWKGRVYTSA